MQKIATFIERMKKIGIEITLLGNCPWLYFDSINGNRVVERFYGNHGFTIGFTPIRPGQQFEFLDIGKMFDIIRKYR